MLTILNVRPFKLCGYTAYSTHTLSVCLSVCLPVCLFSSRKELRWDDLETTRRKHIAILMYKIVNKRPGYLIDLFEKSNSIYTLRESKRQLLLPKYNTEFAKGSSFAFVGAKMWNSIPFNIRSATALSAFKTKINNLAVF